jgi:hypothetical protein
MDHPCETCAHPVEDGIPFCPHCRAPQIRVVVLEAETGSSPVGGSDSSSVSFHPNSIQWALALPVCASAGILAGFLMALVGPSILWMLAAGFLSVLFYRRRHPAINPSPRTGARLGGAAGVIGLAVFFAAAVYNGLLREMLSQAVAILYAKRADPNLRAGFDMYLEFLKRPEGLGTWIFCLAVFFFAFFVIGGALGAAILGRRDRK